MRSQDPQASQQDLELEAEANVALTSSWVSAWKAALTPMMKGVGVLRTSRSCAGKMGT